VSSSRLCGCAIADEREKPPRCGRRPYFRGVTRSLVPSTLLAPGRHLIRSPEQVGGPEPLSRESEARTRPAPAAGAPTEVDQPLSAEAFDELWRTFCSYEDWDECREWVRELPPQAQYPLGAQLAYVQEVYQRAVATLREIERVAAGISSGLGSGGSGRGPSFGGRRGDRAPRRRRQSDEDATDGHGAGSDRRTGSTDK
jgi:hypothetical protein